MPAVFVGIWSTGFVVARYAMPHSPPLTFLAWRFAISLAAFSLWIALARPAWPRSPRQWLHLAITGALMLASYRYLVRSTFMGQFLNGRRHPRRVGGENVAVLPSR